MKDKSIKGYFKNSFSSDLSAGLVVFLVAIPLCLGIALASDAPLMSGIIAGVIGGIVVGMFGGSELGVSGPAAGLVSVVLAAAAALGNFETLLLATMLAGAMQIIMGQLRAGVIAYYVPNAVITGMLAAIGLIIILKQIPHAVGYDLAPEGEMSFLSADGHNTLSDLKFMLGGLEPGAILITLVGLAVLILWDLKALKNLKFFKAIPGPLVAIVLGGGMAAVFNQFVPGLAIAADHMVQLPTDGSVASLLTFPDFSQIMNGDVWFYGLMIALVGGVEALVCAEATDKLDPQKRITPMNKELTAQGIGNMACGLIGGLPLTQVIVRSSANIQTGGKTRGAAIIHGLMIVAAVLIFPRIMNMIPLASLAAILIMVGFRLVRPSIIKSMFKKGFTQFIPFVVTIVAILLTDLLIGIGIGVAVAVVLILRNNFRTPFSYHFEQSDNRPHIRMTLSEIVSFLNKGEILSTLQLIPEGAVLEIDGRRAKVIDPDVMEVLEDFMENAKHRDILVEMIGVDKDAVPYAAAQSLKQKLIKRSKKLELELESELESAPEPEVEPESPTA